MEEGIDFVKQSLKEVPLQERSVLVALRFIQDQIEQLNIKEREEVAQTHQKFVTKFTAFDKRVSIIIDLG